MMMGGTMEIKYILFVLLYFFVLFYCVEMVMLSANYFWVKIGLYFILGFVGGIMVSFVKR